MKDGKYSSAELQAIANKLLRDREVTYGDEFGTFISQEKYDKLDADAKKAFSKYSAKPESAQQAKATDKVVKTALTVEKGGEGKPAKVKAEKPAKVEKPAKPAKVEKPTTQTPE